MGLPVYEPGALNNGTNEPMNSAMSMLEEPTAELGHHISEENWLPLPSLDDELAPFEPDVQKGREEHP